MMRPPEVERVNAYHDAHGRAWGVIEGAGMEDGDRWTSPPLMSFEEACKYRASHYDPDERDSLSVMVARWDREGEFWSYDY